jgi:predicted DNA-binding transcriptional regulator YafY
MNVLTETVEMLKQFKDFSLFNEMTDIIHRLEDKIYVEKTNNRPIIHLDKNDKLKGIHYLDVLYQAILKKIVLKIEYQSFKSRSSNVFVFHPFLLKEYNNRWFIIGKKKLNEDYLNLALDRIISIDFDLSVPYIESDLDPEEYYRNTIGVTVNEKMKPQKVTFLIEKTNAPYVKTKPFHHSQIVIDENELGTVFQVEVVLNFELERLILGFGDSIEVLNPRFLRKRISRILLNAGNKYNQDYID